MTQTNFSLTRECSCAARTDHLACVSVWEYVYESDGCKTIVCSREVYAKQNFPYFFISLVKTYSVGCWCWRGTVRCRWWSRPYKPIQIQPIASKLCPTIRYNRHKRGEEEEKRKILLHEEMNHLFFSSKKPRSCLCNAPQGLWHQLFPSERTVDP